MCGQGDAVSAVCGKVEECIRQANRFFDIRLPVPECNFRQKGRSAGTAYLQKHEVRFNYFMYQQDPDRFLDTVVPHEVAHLVVYQLFGTDVKPHGVEWQRVMEHVFGVEPERTHKFQTPPPKKSYPYRCQCQRHELSSQRHSRAKKGTQYICKMCRTTLSYLHENA